MTILVMLNNFLHDFSAAGWIFGTVLLWIALRRPHPAGEAGQVTADILQKLLLMMWISLGGIVVFGIFRALAYKNYEWNALAGNSQVTLLVVKHILLTALVILGFIFCARAKKRIKENNNEQ